MGTGCIGEKADKVQWVPRKWFGSADFVQSDR